MRKLIVLALVSLLVAGSASAETTKLSVKFKGGVYQSNKTGSAVFGVTAEGTAPFGKVTLQSSKDGVSGWKSFTKAFALSSTGTATKRVNNATVLANGAYVRAQTYGQNTKAVHSVAKLESK